VTSKSICEVCGAAVREHEPLCKNCSSSTIQESGKRLAGLGDGFWLSALVGLFTSYIVGGFFIYGDAGIATPQWAVTVVVCGLATQIGSWYLGAWLIRRGHRLAAWMLLAFPFIFVWFSVAMVFGLIESII
jgi:hypothetical protein